MIPYDKRSGKIWYNGELVDWSDVKLHVLSHGLHYASCVFEGERVYDGSIFKLEEHTSRLFHSARRMGFNIPYDKEVLKDVGSFKILKRKGDITFSEGEGYEQSFRHGHWKSYSDVDGELTSEGDYAYGKQDGKWEYYYPGGVVVATENVYDEGMLNGVSKTYTRRGEVQNEIGYKNIIKLSSSS